MLIVVVATSVVLAAGPAWGQAPAGQSQQTPPAGQQTTPPASQQQAPAPQPPRPFPEGAKIAWVNINLIAANSEEGKAATGKIEEFVKKKRAEIQEKQKALEGLQSKLQQGLSVMSDQARQSLEKDITKQNRDLQILQEDAQTEQQQLTQQLQSEFQKKLFPVVDALAKEKGLHMVFSIADSGILWPDPGLDLTTEVIKRFDAAAKTGTTKK
jgi:Skp family chaperone for outer membrane proteins